MWCTSIRLYQKETALPLPQSIFLQQDERNNTGLGLLRDEFKAERIQSKFIEGRMDQPMICPVSGTSYPSNQSVLVTVGSIMRYLQALSEMPQCAKQVAQYTKESMDLEFEIETAAEAGNSTVASGRLSSGSIGEEILTLTHGERERVAKRIMDMAKRHIFGHPSAAEGDRLRLLLSHQVCLSYLIPVCEDVALASAQVPVVRHPVHTCKHPLCHLLLLLLLGGVLTPSLLACREASRGFCPA